MEHLVQRYMLCVCVLCVQIEHRVVGIQVWESLFKCERAVWKSWHDSAVMSLAAMSSSSDFVKPKVLKKSTVTTDLDLKHL